MFNVHFSIIFYKLLLCFYYLIKKKYAAKINLFNLL